MNNFDDFDRQFERTKNGIIGTGVFIVIVNIIIFALLIWGVIAGCSYVKKNGLKSVANKVWNGETNTVQKVEN